MKLNQNGASSLMPQLIVVSALLFFALAFGIWAFGGRQKYKNNVDQLIAVAVANADQKQQTSDSQKFALEQEDPLITYDGPEAYGSLVVKYPRTWSSFVDTSSGNGYPIDGYFYPGTLPDDNDGGSTNFSLRIQVESNSYSQVLSQYSNQQLSGLVTVTPYSLPKVPSVVGVEIVGQLEDNKTGTLVILPLRNEALEIWTEGSQYLTDFNNNILPNFSFSP